MRGQSPRGSPNDNINNSNSNNNIIGMGSPVLNLSKSGNEQGSAGDGETHSERSANSPNPSIREDDDNLSEGNVSEVDEGNDKDDDG